MLSFIHTWKKSWKALCGTS